MTDVKGSGEVAVNMMLPAALLSIIVLVPPGACRVTHTTKYHFEFLR